MTTPAIGSKVANFVLPNQSGVEVSLNGLLGHWVLIYFYPKALTPGCTTQACKLRDIQSELLDHKVVTLGVSPDPVSKLQKFREVHQLNFDLLSDLDHHLASAFGVWALKKFMGKEFLGVVRTSFLVDPSGQLAAVLDDFKTSNHHEKVLALVKKLG